MALDDPQDFTGGLENERQRLADSDDVYDCDREAIVRWLHRKDGTVTVSSLKTYLRRVRVGSERAEMSLLDMDEPDYQDLIFSLRHDYDLADSTVESYEAGILIFLGDMTDAEWPDDVERTSVDTGGPDVDDMLDQSDIGALTSAANSQRDVAFIEFLADTGTRLSMALSLRVKDLDLSDPPTYSPNPDAIGLKGATVQDYPLIDSVAALRGYLRGAHPRPDDPDVALFHKLQPAARADGDRWGDDDGGLRANAARQQLVRVADRAELDKPVNPHAFRHAAITRMVREGYSRSQVEHRVHWTLDTDMWETYEHVTGEEHNTDIFREAGVIEEGDGPDRAREKCGNCLEPLPPHQDFCGRCGTAVTTDAREAVDDSKGTVVDRLVEATNPVTRRELRQLLEEIEEREDTAHTDSS